MRKFANFVVRFKYVIIAAFALLTAVSGALYFFTDNINSDITSYLPPSSASAQGQKFIKDAFGINGDLVAVVEEEGDTESAIDALVPYAEKIAAIDHVARLMWIGAVRDTLDNAVPDIPALDFTELKEELAVKYEELKGALVREGCYAFVITLDVSASDSAAFGVIDAIEEVFAGREVAFSGTTYLARNVFNETLYALPVFTAIGVAMIALILFLTTGTFIEPIILLASIGVSILVNMGSNFFFGDVSIISHSCAGVLQLGLTMDYAIFLMHSYKEEYRLCLDEREAIKRAIPRTAVTVAASALTTVGGFVALCFMRITIGIDIAKVLIKGIGLSFVTIMLLQPSLILACRKLLRKGRHPYIRLEMNGAVNAVSRHRGVSVTLCALLIIAAFLGQYFIEYDYLKMTKEDPSPTAAETFAADMGNTVIVCLPEGNTDKQYAFIDTVKADGSVEYVMGVYSLVPEEYAPLLKLFPEVTEGYIADGYVMYMIGLDTDIESQDGYAALERLAAAANSRFGDDYYITGTAQAVYDLKSITPIDLTVVTLISLALVFLILLATIRSFKRTFLIVLLIQGGIWINIAASAIFPGHLNFITVIAVNAIQLGATIDYAILMTGHFDAEMKRCGDAAKASVTAAKRSVMSILTSAVIMISACMSVFFVSDNIIVSEITSMIARGSFISAALVLVVLPGLLYYSTKKIFKPRKRRAKPTAFEQEEVK